MRRRLHSLAARVGFSMLLMPPRRRRIGSWLYHWGSGRLDLHRSDYGGPS